MELNSTISVGTDIFDAVQRGSLERCVTLIQQDQSLLARKGWSGFTPLHYAAFQGNRGLVELLLQHGADPNLPNDAGQTPFHFACRHGDVHVIHRMLKYEADVNLTDHQWKTALHHAVIGGNLFAIRYLEELGTFNFCDTDKCLLTPLHLAASTGNTYVVKYLLRNSRCQAYATDNQRMTPMHIAAEKGAIEISWLLLQAVGFRNLHLKAKNGLTPLDIANKGRTYRHQELAKVLNKYSKEPHDRKPRESYGMYYWTLLFPGVSASVVFLISSALGKYGGIFCALVFPWLAKTTFSQYHRMSDIQRLPNPAYLGTFAAGIFHSLVCFFYKILPTLWPANTLLLVSATHFSGILWMFKVVLTKDPGRLQSDESETKFSNIADLVDANENLSKFCVYCEVFQPERAKHCKLCNCCVLEYDHHCIFLKNCIGKNNHQFFILFIMGVAVAHLIFTFSALYYIYLKFDPHFWALLTTVISNEAWVIVLAVMNILSLVWEGWLLMEQFEVVSVGTTIYFKHETDAKRYTWRHRCRTFFTFLMGGRRTSKFQEKVSAIL
ncbi:putative ZDHHC-type palmitoyltransferase 6 [Polyodon spathula]|nr:putative ZDHHC-type palmitoyltransferase 6 [Polyodon spathula]